MKTIAALLIQSILFLTVNLFAQENPDKTYPLEFKWQKSIAEKKVKSIRDYFYLLPSYFIECEGAMFNEYSTKEKRDETISKVDLKNGYLTWFDTSQLVLFKDRKKKVDIIAIQSGKCGAGTTCGGLNSLLEFKNNIWKFRVDLLPYGKTIEETLYKNEVCPYFDLPQYGTTILVKDENKNDALIKKFIWTRERFKSSN